MLLKNGKDSFEALKYMQQMGIDINSHNEGYSPLQFISYYDEFIIQKIELLLKQKININYQDKDGDTPLHQFCLQTTLQFKTDQMRKKKNYLRMLIVFYY